MSVVTPQCSFYHPNFRTRLLGKRPLIRRSRFSIIHALPSVVGQDLGTRMNKGEANRFYYVCKGLFGICTRTAWVLVSFPWVAVIGGGGACVGSTSTGTKEIDLRRAFNRKCTAAAHTQGGQQILFFGKCSYKIDNFFHSAKCKQQVTESKPFGCHVEIPYKLGVAAVFLGSWLEPWHSEFLDVQVFESPCQSVLEYYLKIPVFFRC